MNIIIFGAGKTGQYLAKSLSSEGNDIIVVEKNRSSMCTSLQRHLDATIIESQGINKEVFNEEVFAECDLFIAVSSVDELNIFHVQLQKKAGPIRLWPG